MSNLKLPKGISRLKCVNFNYKNFDRIFCCSRAISFYYYRFIMVLAKVFPMINAELMMVMWKITLEQQIPKQKSMHCRHMLSCWKQLSQTCLHVDHPISEMLSLAAA